MTVATPNPQSQAATGLATDALGNPTIDPTKNVLDLVAAAIQRQDDLRQAESDRLGDLAEKTADIRDAKFDALRRELVLIEDRRKEQKVDTKTAVDAALLAAKEAVKEQTTASAAAISKSETAAAEQSKQQNATFTAALKGITDGFNDMKERVGKIETRTQTIGEGRSETRLDMNTLIAAFAIIAVIAMALLK